MNFSPPPANGLNPVCWGVASDPAARTTVGEANFSSERQSSPENYPTLREGGSGWNAVSRRMIEPRLPRPAGEMLSPLHKPLGFNCPACRVILVIRDPDAYDGQAAPCPHCGVHVMPPRVVYAAVDIDLQPLPGLSNKGGLAGKTPRAIHRIDRRGQLNWQSAEARPALAGPGV